MKTRTIKLMMMATAMLSLALFASCGDDDGPTPAKDRTDLATTIASATTLKTTTVEGTEEDQFPTHSKDALQAAIDAATEVFLDADATQKQVNAANANLQTAVDAYLALRNAPIASENLVARWRFDEGSGTSTTDDSGNGHTGTFKTGPATWGAGTPTWTTDRHGNVNHALHFDDGANVEIPYNSALNPTAALSFSVWVKTDVVKAGNRFLGLWSWIGYKFELQDLNHAFVSVGYDGGTYDKDGQVAIPNAQWHHLVATFGGGKTILYADGTAIAASTYNDTPNAAKNISATPYNLVIGEDFPADKYAATTTNFDTDKIIPLEWGGYFQGSLDELRIYKVALTAQQVGQIYTNEKPD